MPKLSSDERYLRDQARDAVKEAKREWGTGWDRLSPEQKDGAISRKLVRHVINASTFSDESQHAVHYLARLYRAMHAEIEQEL